MRNLEPDDECRNCSAPIKSYRDSAVVIKTGKQAKWNHFGGWVCSPWCDKTASLDLMSSMPGAGPAKSLNGAEKESFQSNWRDES